MPDYSADDLVYAATDRCACGAGLAYAPGSQRWQCSAVLLGTGDRNARHTDPIAMSARRVVSENDAAGLGQSTRQSTENQPAALEQHRADFSGQMGPETTVTSPAPPPLSAFSATPPPARQEAIPPAQLGPISDAAPPDQTPDSPPSQPPTESLP